MVLKKIIHWEFNFKNVLGEVIINQTYMTATFVSVEMTEEEKNYEDNALAFLSQKNVSSPKEFFDKLDNLGKNKLEHLIKGDITSKKTTFRQEYQKFTDAVPVWNYSLDYVDHNVSKTIKKLMVMTQKSGKTMK